MQAITWQVDEAEEQAERWGAVRSLAEEQRAFLGCVGGALALGVVASALFGGWLALPAGLAQTAWAFRGLRRVEGTAPGTVVRVDRRGISARLDGAEHFAPWAPDHGISARRGGAWLSLGRYRIAVPDRAAPGRVLLSLQALRDAVDSSPPQLPEGELGAWRITYTQDPAALRPIGAVHGSYPLFHPLPVVAAIVASAVAAAVAPPAHAEQVSAQVGSAWMGLLTPLFGLILGARFLVASDRTESGPHSLNAGVGGLYVTSPVGWSRLAWSAVSRVQRDGDRILLWCVGNRIFVVPVAGFASEAEAEAFVVWAAARTSESTPSEGGPPRPSPDQGPFAPPSA